MEMCKQDKVGPARVKTLLCNCKKRGTRGSKMDFSSLFFRLLVCSSLYLRLMWFSDSNHDRGHMFSVNVQNYTYNSSSKRAHCVPAVNWSCGNLSPLAVLRHSPPPPPPPHRPSDWTGASDRKSARGQAEVLGCVPQFTPQGTNTTCYTQLNIKE